MNNFVDELSKSAIITKTYVIELKKEINEKYANSSDAYKAAILAKKIHDILDNNLIGLESEYRESIKIEVIKNTFLNNKDEITKAHIYSAFVPVVEKQPSLKKQLIEWINENQSINISEDIFDSFILSQSENKKKNINIIQKLETCLSKTKDYLNISKKSLIYASVFIVMTTFLISLLLFENENSNIENTTANCQVSEVTYIPKQSEYKEYYAGYMNTKMRYHPWIPQKFNYNDVNKDKLLKFLRNRNSILAEEPYFSTILHVSKQFNINPLLLFAIAGQEQGFVPKDNEYAEKIANNPFNVFNSWQKYNTNIYDSTTIAAKTIINLSKDKPNNIDLFDWLNKRYAEDKNWSKGVKLIFQELNR